MDKERIEGFREAFEPGETLRWEIPKTEKERMCFYEDKYRELVKSNVTAVFAVSDFYALEFMRFLLGKGIQIPKDIQIIGFDDNMASRESILRLQRFIRRRLLGQKLQSSVLRQCAMARNVRPKSCCRLS